MVVMDIMGWNRAAGEYINVIYQATTTHLSSKEGMGNMTSWILHDFFTSEVVASGIVVALMILAFAKKLSLGVEQFWRNYSLDLLTIILMFLVWTLGLVFRFIQFKALAFACLVLLVGNMEFAGNGSKYLGFLVMTLAIFTLSFYPDSLIAAVLVVAFALYTS